MKKSLQVDLVFNFQIPSSNSQLCEFFWLESPKFQKFHRDSTLGNLDSPVVKSRALKAKSFRRRRVRSSEPKKLTVLLGMNSWLLCFWLNMTWQFEVYRNVNYYEVLRCEFGIAKRKFESIIGCRRLDSTFAKSPRDIQRYECGMPLNYFCCLAFNTYHSSQKWIWRPCSMKHDHIQSIRLHGCLIQILPRSANLMPDKNMLTLPRVAMGIQKAK